MTVSGHTSGYQHGPAGVTEPRRSIAKATGAIVAAVGVLAEGALGLVICLRHTGASPGEQASRSHLLPCYPRAALGKHTTRWRDQRGEARRPGSSRSGLPSRRVRNRLHRPPHNMRLSLRCDSAAVLYPRPIANQVRWAVPSGLIVHSAVISDFEAHWTIWDGAGEAT